jgi:hypothetical protein
LNPLTQSHSVYFDLFTLWGHGGSLPSPAPACLSWAETPSGPLLRAKGYLHHKITNHAYQAYHIGIHAQGDIGQGDYLVTITSIFLYHVLRTRYRNHPVSSSHRWAQRRGRKAEKGSRGRHPGRGQVRGETCAPASLEEKASGVVAGSGRKVSDKFRLT